MASICLNTCASTIRSARSRFTRWRESGAPSRSASSRPASMARQPRLAKMSARGHRPVLWRRLRRAESADDRELLGHHRDLRRRDGADVRGEVSPSGCASRPKARSKASIIHEHGFPAYPEYVVTGDDGCAQDDRRCAGRAVAPSPSASKKTSGITSGLLSPDGSAFHPLTGKGAGPQILGSQNGTYETDRVRNLIYRSSPASIIRKHRWQETCST